MRRDAIFYQIFQRFPSLLFELVDHPPLEAQRYRFESVEVKESSFRIDGVFLPPDDAADKTVFFAEIQFQKDDDLYHRFFCETFLYLYRNRTLYTDWQGVVIFPSRSLEPENTTVHRALLASAQVQRIYLDELTSSDQQPVGIRLMQLTIAPEADAIAQARELIERVQQESTASLPKDEIIDIITTIAVYKFANLSREEVEAMLGLKLEETRVYQEAKAEGERSNQVKMIPKLLARGLSIEEIAEIVELAVQEVRQIISTSS
jgi:predicted transposase/invertase (TIGR01784 family)